MTIIFNFALALISTFLVGMAAKWLAGKFTDASAARVAGFAAACGYGIGKYSFAAPAGTDITAPAAAAVGALIALAIVWFMMFRRNGHTAR
jgi:hypothetical protein